MASKLVVVMALGENAGFSSFLGQTLSLRFRRVGTPQTCKVSRWQDDRRSDSDTTRGTGSSSKVKGLLDI